MVSNASTDSLDLKDERLTRHSLETGTLLPHDGVLDTNRKRNRTLIWFWVAQAALLSTSILILLLSISMRHVDPVNCVRKHSTFSPALEAVDDDYEKWRFNGTFRHRSPYKGPPSPSVDETWNRVTAVGDLSIDHDTLQKIEAPENSVKLPPESGGGYLGGLEVFHQIHCVNLLWQSTYEDYYKNRSLAWTDSRGTLRQHFDHCADLLRQKLMCDADVGIITYNWVKDHDLYYPNFNTVHKCRNFEDIYDWAIAHQAHAPNGGLVIKPDDAEELELPP